jgi:hypothetical protein
VLYNPGNVFTINVNIGYYCTDGISCFSASTSCKIYQDPVPYIQTSLGDTDGYQNPYSIVTKYYQPNQCSNQVFYPKVVYTTTFPGFPGTYGNNVTSACAAIYFYNYTNQDITIQFDTYYNKKYASAYGATVNPNQFVVASGAKSLFFPTSTYGRYTFSYTKQSLSGFS